MASSTDLGYDEGVAADAGAPKKLPVNQKNLKKAWEASQRSTKDDWAEWLRRFSVELLKESPSHALRACSSLAAVYHPLARELFNAGFVSCWTELYDQFQDELIKSLETALTSPSIPPEILQIILNLAEVNCVAPKTRRTGRAGQRGQVQEGKRTSDESCPPRLTITSHGPCDLPREHPCEDSLWNTTTSHCRSRSAHWASTAPAAMRLRKRFITKR